MNFILSILEETASNMNPTLLVLLSNVLPDFGTA